LDEISSQAISIAVGVFVTIAIVSGVFYVINEMKVIYEQVYETDISIQSSFSEFEQYDNTVKTGIDVLNVVKKYLNNSQVKITISGVEIDETSTFYTNYVNKKNTDQLENFLSKLGEDRYNSSVITDDATGITTIAFVI